MATRWLWLWLASIALVACREAPSLAPPSPTDPASARTVHEPTDTGHDSPAESNVKRQTLDMAAEGRAGVVHLFDDDGSALRIRLVKAGRETVERIFDQVDEPLDAARVRFADIDHDGLPDIVIDRGPKVGSPPARFFVFLTHQVDFKSREQPDIETDRGSPFYLLHAESIDAAVTALENVPHRGLTASQACALIESVGFQRPPAYAIVPEYDFGTCPFKDPETVLSCHAKVPDGPGFVTPVMRCDDWRPYCEFELRSGGRDGTPIPPSERRYWFDWTQGKNGNRLGMIASAGWQGLCPPAADAGSP